MMPIGAGAEPPRAESVVPPPPGVEAPHESLTSAPPTERTPNKDAEPSGVMATRDVDEHLIPLPYTSSGNFPDATTPVYPT
jgi:hypothetical protein